ACKEWNLLPSDHPGLTGMSYDNTGDLSAYTWRHVAFIEKIQDGNGRATEMAPFQSNWLMMSDVCQHCGNAPCLEACPTGARLRTKSATAAVRKATSTGSATASPRAPSASSTSTPAMARRTSARSATTG